jgi:hypothetical protein
MPVFSTRRTIIARSLSLVIMLAVYVSVFGVSVSDDAQPAVPAATPPAAAPSAVGEDWTDALQQQLDQPNRASSDRWTGLVERRITRTLVIDLDKVGPAALRGLGLSRIVMAGPGPALRIIGTHGGTADPDSVQPNVWERQRMPIVDGLEIVGDHPEACGIELVGTMQATITHVNIRRCLHAIQLVQRNRNVLIADSHLYENRGCGVLLDDVDLHQINITGSHISYNAGGGVVSRKGNVRNLHITGCDIESNMSADTEPTANVLIDCGESKNGTAEVAITGCTIQHNSPGPDSANVRILGRSDPTPEGEVVREGHVTITGNVFSDVQCNVHLQDCRGVTLQGNTFWMGYQHNLLVEDCTHIVVGPNNLDRNPRYAYGTALTTKNAVVFRRCADCTITGLHVAHVWNSEAGVVFDDCQWMNVGQCTILDCDGAGLLARNCRDCRFAGLMIRDTRVAMVDPLAIQIDGGQNILLVPDGLIKGRVQDTSESPLFRPL